MKLKINFQIIAAGLLVLAPLACGGSGGASSTVVTAPAPVGSFTPTGQLNYARAGHSATLLLDGKVLIAGGATFDGSRGPTGTANYTFPTHSEVYDPVTGTFSPGPAFVGASTYYGATRLQDGRVLFINAAGPTSDHSSSEVFDPRTGTFTRTGKVWYERYAPTASLLGNGQVLLTGGMGVNDAEGLVALDVAEVYDPVTSTFSPTAKLNEKRRTSVSVSLQDGTVLVMGGTNGKGEMMRSAEVYDPRSGTFTLVGNMMAGRDGFTAVRLANGKVLILGGLDDVSYRSRTGELYDPATRTFRSLRSGLPVPRDAFTATLLADGRVLILGGYDTNGKVIQEACLFDPATESFLPAGHALDPQREGHSATLLPSGQVLIVGGNVDVRSLASAELFR